jgi:hypothetical protein
MIRGAFAQAVRFCGIVARLLRNPGDTARVRLPTGLETAILPA